MRISRRFTQEGQSPYTGIDFELRTSEIKNPDGSTVFRQEGSRCRGLVARRQRHPGPEIFPEVRGAAARRRTASPCSTRKGAPFWEASATPGRFSIGWPAAGPTGARNTATSTRPADARAFYDELCHMLAAQVAAPNSPQWFNTGLHWAYGLTGPAQGHHYVDPDTGALTRATSAYERPQPSACFIQSVADDLVNDGGIMDLWTREARIFKYGSGTGSNFSALRGENEPLSGGGKSSGLMSFLKIGDRAAGAIKSGGTTRRAAKMVCLDLDHPDVIEFIRWKVVEEQKVAALVAGSRLAKRRLQAVMAACQEATATAAAPHQRRSQDEPRASLGAPRSARGHGARGLIQKVLQLAAQGIADFTSPSTTRTGTATPISPSPARTRTTACACPIASSRCSTRTASGRSRAAPTAPWLQRIPAAEIWDEIAYAAWASADPGVQYDTTINEWHTCPEDGRINASNPCVTGDTLVATAEGWRRIDELVGRSARIIGADGQPHLVTRIFPTGRKPIYTLTTRAGYRVRITGDHRVLTTERGDVAVKDLTTDDRLVLQGPGFGRRTLPDEPRARDRRRGGRRLPDALHHQRPRAADGHPHDARRTRRRSWRSVAEAVNAQKAALKVAGSVGRNDGVHVARSATGARLAFGSRPRRRSVPASSRCSTKGPSGSASLPRCSSSIVPRSRPCSAGSSPRTGRWPTTARSRSMSRWIPPPASSSPRSSSCCSRSGSSRSSTRIGVETATLTLLPDGKGGSREYPVVPMFSLRISRSSRVIFEREIGFHPESPKAAALRRLNAEVATYRDELTDRVASIEPAGEEDVFDLTEDVTHHFVAGGLVVHNCSEYMFLDDTACNLASINLVKFLREDGSLRRRGLPARLPAVDDGARDQRADGAPTRARRSPRRAGTSARWASATPTWARCSCARASRTTRAEAAAIVRRHHRHHERRGLRDLRRDGARTSAPSPASRRTARTCCA